MNYRLPLFCLSLIALPASNAGTIYRCDLADGSVSLQRQRCDGAATEQRYTFTDNVRDDSNRSAERTESIKPATKSRRRTTPRVSTKPRRNVTGKQLTQCRKLWNREDDLRDTLRDGYSAAEGEQMRREQRRIKRDKELLLCDELD